ncbi:MAG TPA: ATP-binding protein [Gammaproteobacteria bacterium]
MALVRSLRARVLLWVSVALTVLFAVTVATLDATFRRSTETARREVLEAQVLGLIGLAEPTSDGELTLPPALLDPQFQVPDSGVYGILWDAEGHTLWQSGSLLGRELSVKSLPEPGVPRYVALRPDGFPPLEALLLTTTWPFDDGHVEPFTFGIAVSLDPYLERQSAFRSYLIGWFAAITGVTLLVLTGLLRFVLRPLRTLERQVREVEAGRRLGLTGDFPAELTPLAHNLNALIGTERKRLVRYRNMLDDLAHSLKTPLAAMRSLLPELGDAGEASAALARELERMDQRVSYQLRRARASGATGLGVEPVAVAEVLGDLKRTLDKVYRDKRVECVLRVADGAVFHGDRGDLTELLGNLLDNAYKYCGGRVEAAAGVRDGRLVVTIGDDGAGIDAGAAQLLLERGARADESVPGHGIGLAVVRETVELYDGTLAVAKSPLGGAELRVELGRAGIERVGAAEA